MYVNTGYRNQIDTDVSENNEPLLVESCGVYRLIKQPVMTTSRPKGRLDYQILYISSGSAIFTVDGVAREIEEGNMVLYRPGEVQHYMYRLEDQPEIYWIHFTGYEVENILNQYGIGPEDRVIQTGIIPEYAQLLRQMIRELQVQRAGCDELLSLLLRQMFCLMQRSQLEKGQSNGKIKKEMECAIHYFNENFSETIQIGEYARANHMSTCWFIRSFRQYIGVAPMQYLTSIRIAKAKGLLEGSDYNVGEIGAIVGYDNPLYFSRLFRKVTGVSPVQYRKSK